MQRAGRTGCACGEEEGGAARAPALEDDGVHAVRQVERAQVGEALREARALQALRLEARHQPPRARRPPPAHQPRHLRRMGST